MNERAPLVIKDGSGAGDRVLRTAIEHTPNTDSQSTVNCQVCTNVIQLGNKEKHMVVKCPICLEATPIRGAPPDKQYVRCPCNCLLICRASTMKVGCPRTNCQRIIILVEGSQADGMDGGVRRGPNGAGMSGMMPNTIRDTDGIRVVCGNCSGTFSVSPPEGLPTPNALVRCLTLGSAHSNISLVAARCPHCHKVTSVGRGYSRLRVMVFSIITLIFFIISMAVTFGTREAAYRNSGLYFLWLILYLVTIALGVRALFFCKMPVSTVEVPNMQL